MSGIKNTGFILIALLAVVLIVGIFAAAGLPKYQLAADKAEFTSYTPAAEAAIFL